MPKRSEALEAIFAAEIKARQTELDGDHPLDSVTAHIRLAPDGRVLDIDFRTAGRRAVSARKLRAS